MKKSKMWGGLWNIVSCHYCMLSQAVFLGFICSVYAGIAEAQLSSFIAKEVAIPFKPRPPVPNWLNMNLNANEIHPQGEIRPSDSFLHELKHEFVKQARDKPLEFLIEDTTKCLFPKHKDDLDCKPPQQLKYIDDGFFNVQ